MAKKRSNPDPSEQRQSTCQLNDLDGWVQSEALALPEGAIRRVVLEVARNLDEFISWPAKALLLMPGCNRGVKFHSYPTRVRDSARAVTGFRLDPRSNGPAITAFLLGGGHRPKRCGGRTQWSIHHLYFGRFAYPGRTDTLHAVRDGMHFTQSAGLVAAHPIADQICGEFPFFTWMLRAMAFLRFGYDPDRVFGADHDAYGFVPPRHCEVWECEPAT